MNKHQRALRAARAAKRLPLVGTAVVLLPLVEAASGTMDSRQLTSIPAWTNFGKEIVHRYTGVINGSVDGVALLTTWLPIAGYIIAKKVGLARPVGRVLGKIGLRF